MGCTCAAETIENSTSYIPTKYQQKTIQIPTKYQQNSKKYQQNSNKIPTKYQQYTKNKISTNTKQNYQQNSNKIPTKFQQNINKYQTKLPTKIEISELLNNFKQKKEQ